MNLSGATPLVIAITRGHYEIVKCLIKANANVNATNINSIPLISIAS